MAGSSDMTCTLGVEVMLHLVAYHKSGKTHLLLFELVQICPNLFKLYRLVLPQPYHLIA